jgi:hypothetical protein
VWLTPSTEFKGDDVLKELMTVLAGR